MNLLSLKNIFSADFLEKYGLVFILALFVAFGIVGIFYNYSISNTIGEESILMAATLKMIAELSLRPNYPTMYHMPFGTYFYLPFFIVLLVFLRLSGLFASLEELKVFGITDYEKLLPMARFISIFLGVASVYMVYRICEKLFNNKFISLVASFLLATNLIFVQMSHFGKVWIIQIFIVLLTFYFIVALYQKERPGFKDYFYPALLTAISFGVHFIGILIYLPFLTAHYLKNKEKKFREIFITNRNFWLSNLVIAIILLFIFYLNPYGFANYGLRSVAAAAAIIQESAGASGGYDFWLMFSNYGKVLFENGPALTIIFVFSLIPLFLRRRDLFFIFNSFIFGYYIIIGPILGPTIGINGRGFYISPIIPFMAVVSAFGIYVFYKSDLLGKRINPVRNIISNGIKIFLLALVFLFSAYIPILWNYKLIQPSAWILAKDWIYNNLPSGVSIINLNTELPINENKESVEDTRVYTPNFFTKKQDYLSSVGDNQYPKPNYYVLKFADYREGIPKAVLDRGFDYMVIEWWDQARYEKTMQDVRQLNLEEINLIKIFPAGASSTTLNMDMENIKNPLINLRKIDHTGPVIAIYKLK
ncbi:MAG: glycosyltransferase family 39 protein [Candidatus Niyogibacteria bacterium]|nr:glycosyltransferase family 39 protein [Candidatus Niyogibacteria bacterium]